MHSKKKREDARKNWDSFVGLKLLREMKKHCIEHDSWSSFTRLRRAAEGREANVADLRNLDLLWTKVVRRLHERVYENEEARGTPLEQLEALMSKDPKLAQDSLLRMDLLRAQTSWKRSLCHNLTREAGFHPTWSI